MLFRSLQMYFNASISGSTKLLKPLLVFGFCMAAALSGLTQITQHRSHPIDVYMGYVIGAGIGVYLVSVFMSCGCRSCLPVCTRVCVRLRFRVCDTLPCVVCVGVC